MTKSNKPLSHEQQQQILQLLAEGESKRGVGRILGISDRTVRKYAERLGVDLLSAAADPADPLVNMGRTIARQQERLRQLNQQVKKVNDRGFGYDDFLDALKTFVETEKLKPLTYYPTQITKAKKLGPIPAIDANHSEIISLALSDWHLTETVRLLDSNGINVYNSAIAANRVWNVMQGAKQIVQIHRAAYKVDKLWIPVLGDMVSGSVHPEFIITNDGSDQVASLLGIRLLEMAILELKALDLPIEIDCVVGNHPRTTAKVPTKRIAHSNWDWLIYMFLQMLFRDDDQVNITVHTSQIGAKELFGHRYVFEHGIDWKNGQEEALESNIRDLMDDPVYREATGLEGPAFDQIVIGNLHKPAFLERTIKNGSLIGQNELGQQWRLRPIRAQQLMWGISRQRPRTFQYALDVTNVKSSKVENPFSEFAVQFMKDHGRYSLLS